MIFHLQKKKKKWINEENTTRKWGLDVKKNWNCYYFNESMKKMVNVHLLNYMPNISMKLYLFSKEHTKVNS